MEEKNIHLPKFLLESGVQHLIDNACKFSPQNSKVSIHMTIKNSNNGKDSPVFHFSVQDSGIGIPNHFHDKIFDKHFQVESDINRGYPGLGLGLYLFRNLLNHYRGTLVFESAENLGTKIGFKLPL